MLNQGAPYLHLLRTQEHCGHDGNTILPSVRVPAGRDDHHVRQDGAELLTKPQEMAHVRIRDLRAGLYFNGEHALVACLDDEVNLAPAVVGAAVINACLGGLRIDAYGLSNERLEHLAEKGSPSRRGASVGGIVTSLAPAGIPPSNAPVSTPSRRAASAGSTKWCFGA